MSSTTINSVFRQPLALPSASWCLDRLPIVVLILSVMFLQGYALIFWTGLLGEAGWGVSLGLEILHIWFWYKAAISARFARLSWMILAFAATGLLLAGALHEVIKPLQQESAQIEATDQQRESLKAESRLLNANLAAFRDMAAIRVAGAGGMTFAGIRPVCR